MLKSYITRENIVSTKTGWTRERTVRFSQQKSFDSGKLNETMFRRPGKEDNRISRQRAPSVDNSLPSINQRKKVVIVELQKLTARAAIIYDLDSQQVLMRLGEHEKREIASLTKIMTCWVVLQYIRGCEIIPEDNYLTVSKNAAAMVGTRADLE